MPGVYDDAFQKALQLRDEHGYTFIHPFDDENVIAGQGTIGLELLDQLPDVEAVVLPVVVSEQFLSELEHLLSGEDDCQSEVFQTVRFAPLGFLSTESVIPWEPSEVGQACGLPPAWPGSPPMKATPRRFDHDVLNHPL